MWEEFSCLSKLRKDSGACNRGQKSEAFVITFAKADKNVAPRLPYLRKKYGMGWGFSVSEVAWEYYLLDLLSRGRHDVYFSVLT